MRRLWRCVLGVLVGGFGLAQGCAPDLNARARLGTVYPTPTFQDNPQPALESPADRARWPTEVVVCPIDGVTHNPSPMRPRHPDEKDPPRVYGLYPTVESSVIVNEDNWARAMLGVPFEIGRSFTTLIDPRRWSPPEGNPWSPRSVWKRTPASPEWYAVPPATETSR